MLDATAALSTRQEAFCRHFVASGNAADAARRAGYAERSARQTGCALLERPWIVERVRRIRMSWQRTARDEARIALARLEQAWDAAVASGSAYLMLQTVRLQAEIAGLTRPAAMRRAVLWPLPARTSSARWRKAAPPKPEPRPGRWQRPCAGAGTGPSACSPATLPTGRRLSGRKASTRPRMPEPPNGSRKLSRSGSACPSASSRRPPRPRRKHRPQADDPPEETYEEDGWVGDERPSDDDRVDGAENDWLYQRRNGFAELYDPWTPENIELRRRNIHAWEEARCDNRPFHPDEPDRPDNGEFAPGHDIS